MVMQRAALFLACIILAVAGAGLASAEPPIAVGVDEARIVRTETAPAVVVVGNPSIADVSVQRGQLVVTGRNFGTTNVILLDGDGRQLAQLALTVTGSGMDKVTLFKAGGQFSYVCHDLCQPELMVGDQPEHFDEISKEIGSKSGLATGMSRGNAPQ